MQKYFLFFSLNLFFDHPQKIRRFDIFLNYPHEKAILSTSDQDLIESLASEELYANRHYMYAAACSQAQQLKGFQKFYESEATMNWSIGKDGGT